jgi:NifU-like protein involved in Fe-S cluster formation
MPKRPQRGPRPGESRQMNTAVLYSPRVLGLATALAAYPAFEGGLLGEARSPSCGSTLQVTLKLAEDGSIDRIGLRAHACAIGQASAALFAQAAAGQTADQLDLAHREIARWLAGTGALPGWPGLDAIAAAREYPARHGAILLAWRAALAALSSAPVPR